MNIKKMLSVIMVAVLCLTLFSGCGEDKNSENTTTPSTSAPVDAAEKTIALVGGTKDSGYYEGMKTGGEEAAKKYGFTLDYIGIEDTEQSDSSSQVKKLEELIEGKASAIVVAPLGEGYSDVFTKLYDKKLPVVQIGSITRDDIEDLESNNKNPIIATVSTDYKQTGALCAERMFEVIKADIKSSQGEYVIGIIEGEDNQADAEKTEGFREKFSELADADESLKDKYKIETEEGTAALDELMSEKVKAVFITRSEIADKISDTVSAEKDKYKDIIFCGFDSGAKQLNWLESENSARFIGGVAQDAYNLGYNAVEQCIFSVQGKDLKPEIKIEGHWYDKTNADKMKQDKLIFEK